MVLLEDNVGKWFLYVFPHDVQGATPASFRLFNVVREYSGGTLPAMNDTDTWRRTLETSVQVADDLQELLHLHGNQTDDQILHHAKAATTSPALVFIANAYPEIITRETGADVVPPETFCSIVHIVQNVMTNTRKRARTTS